MSEKWFFLSYARLDRQADKFKCIEKFFDDLNERVRPLKKIREEYAGFFDGTGIEPGESWPDSLGQSLSTCHVMICLYSPAYFDSEYCGKEWEVFRSRVRAKYKDNPPLILPIMFYPPEDVMPLPEAVADIQYINDDFPEVYRNEGLRYLMVRDTQKDNYQDFLDACVRYLLTAGDKYPLSSLDSLPDIKQVASAFHARCEQGAPSPPPDVGPRYAEFIYVAAKREEVQSLKDKGLKSERYGEEGQLDWRPYLPPDEAERPREISSYGQEVAVKEDFRYRQVPLTQELVKHVREAQRNKCLVVIVVDTWTVCLDKYQQIMKEYDEATFYNAIVLIAWNKDGSTPASRDMLNAALWAAFSTKLILKDERILIDSISSPTELETSMSVALQRLKMQVIDAAQVFRKIEGEQVILKPEISGSGGGARP